MQLEKPVPGTKELTHHMPEGLVDHLNAQRRRISVDYYDFTIRELLSMLDSSEINISPSYQRVFRWDEEAESRLIESFFLELPIPSVFAAINTDFAWELVDGLQRVSTLAHFVADPDGVLGVIGRDQPLVLKGLDTLSDLNGMTFKTLPTELQTYFKRRTIRVTALSDQSDVEVRFDLFDRLNRGAVRLTPQEVRACVLRGPFLDLVERLAADFRFVSLTKLQAGDERNGTREELVLKFFAYLYGRGEFKGRVSQFLTDFMRRAPELVAIEDAEQTFDKSVAVLHDLLDGSPFLRTGVHVTPQNQFEGVLVGIGEIVRAGQTVIPPNPDWLDDAELVSASTGGTNTQAMLARRIGRSMTLLGHPPA